MAENEPLEAEYIQNSDSDTKLAVPGTVLPTTIHLLPVFERPFFPAQAAPIVMDEEPWLDTIEAIGETGHHMAGLVMVRSDKLTQLSPADFYTIGSIVRLHQPSRAQDKLQFIAEGLQRFRITKWLSEQPPYLVQVEYLAEEKKSDTDQVRAYAMAIINTIKELLPLNPLYSEELKYFLNRFGPNEPSPLTDFAAGLTTADGHSLQEVLETYPVIERMQRVLVLLKKEMEVAKIQHQIRQRVEDQMSEQQRKFFLREQLKEIQKELGLEKDDRTADLERFKERVEKLTLPEHAQRRLDDEMQKLSVLESGSPEYTVTRNYLDWITSLPWGLDSEDILDLKRARKILDRDHDGLDDVKQRILEFLAVGKLRGTIAGSILLLVGPPGVGKTSIG
ncbi:MAG TPA: LON peptidase substrate-binding domain-containing protein, partial [Gammaproteobacteria bacterium]